MVWFGRIFAPHECELKACTTSDIHKLRVANSWKFSRYKFINRTLNSLNTHAFIASDEGEEGHNFFCVPVQGQKYHDSVRSDTRNFCGEIDTHRHSQTLRRSHESRERRNSCPENSHASLIVCKNTRISSQKRKEVIQRVRNTYEQKILKYKMRCRGINSHIHIFNGEMNQISNDISYYLQNR